MVQAPLSTSPLGRFLVIHKLRGKVISVLEMIPDLANGRICWPPWSLSSKLKLSLLIIWLSWVTYVDYFCKQTEMFQRRKLYVDFLLLNVPVFIDSFRFLLENLAQKGLSQPLRADCLTKHCYWPSTWLSAVYYMTVLQFAGVQYSRITSIPLPVPFPYQNIRCVCLY